MFAILHALGMFVADLFNSRTRLEAENLFLRHQLIIALRQASPRFRLRGGDRALLIWMTRLWPGLAQDDGKKLGRPRIARQLEERILAALKAGETIRGVADKFDVNPSTVQRIKHPFVVAA